MTDRKELSKVTKAELDFINERTRYLLAHVWCPAQIETGSMPTPHENDRAQIYLDNARQRGWVSKKENTVLSPGLKTAAAFLRR